MNNINLSYVLSTYNKLPYLKEVIKSLLGNCLQDEEIVVIDGGSSDGTAEFLEQLYIRGKIHQFISEKDFGEGHGFNKGILMAKGKIIKLLSDDDVFCFDTIRHCKNYMLSDPQIDFLNTHGAYYDCSLNEIIKFTNIYDVYMKEWIETKKPFAFCMLGSMINKKSLSLLGLIHPTMKRADAEYSLRITSQNINFVFSNDIGYVWIQNDKSNTTLFNEKIMRETKKLNSYYDTEIDGKKNENQKEIHEGNHNEPSLIILKLKQFLRHRSRKIPLGTEVSNLEGHLQNTKIENLTIEQIYEKAQQWLAEQFKYSPNTFMHK